jgi:hypothetical protein
MSHECQECGSLCYCDQDDCLLPQPADCRHVCDDRDDEYQDDDAAPDEAPREDDHG